VKTACRESQARAVLRLRRAFDAAIFGTVRRQANSISGPGRTLGAPGFVLGHGSTRRLFQKGLASFARDQTFAGDLDGPELAL